LADGLISLPLCLCGFFLEWILSDAVRYNVGDKVRHRTRPEWGEGTIASAQSATHDGQPAQRLVINFANHGRVTINSALAPIVPADAVSASAESRAQTSGGGAGRGWLSELEGKNLDADALSELPDDVSDPFAALVRRIRLTGDLYRFKREPRSVMEWAVAQSGLTDPLSQFSRNDIEQQFVAFEQAREAHLRSLLVAARKAGDAAAIEEAKQHQLPEARTAADRLMRTL